MLTPHDPVISVIIPVYNDGDQLQHCLAALAAQANGPAFEVVVVDNGSQVLPQDVVAQYPFARLLQEKKPGSYSARNKGVRESKGEILAFIDADCIPSPQWLSNAYRYFSDPAVPAIGGRVQLTVDPESNLTLASKYELAFAFRQKSNVKAGYSVTANLIVRKNVFLHVGYFDDSLLSGGDYNWGQRAKRAGQGIVYGADVVVSHAVRSNFQQLFKKRRRVEGGLTYMDFEAGGRGYAALKGLKPRMSGSLSLFRRSTRPSNVSLADVPPLFFLALVLVVISYIERYRIVIGGKARRV